MLDLDIFSQGLVARESGGWRITVKGRTVLEFMEARPLADEPLNVAPGENAAVPVPRPWLPVERGKRRSGRRQRRRAAREQARVNAS